MKKPVKTLSLITISLFFFTAASSQLKFASQNSSMGNDIKKVLAEYSNCYAGLRGDILIQNPQTTEYECNFKIDGAEESSITVYTSAKKEICSWQALVLTTESFSDAKKKFRSLYTQLNNQAVQIDGFNPMHLKGSYEEPKEEKKFASSVLVLNTGNETLKKLRVEIAMQYEPMEWKVKVLIYDKEREDDERGRLRD